jgi:threonine/homoserine/homoserine lactone efflux protein
MPVSATLKRFYAAFACTDGVLLVRMLAECMLHANDRSRALTPAGGFTLGAANPKVYLAFASLFGSFAIMEPAFGWRDSGLKVVACITITVAIDFAWVLVGVALS